MSYSKTKIGDFLLRSKIPIDIEDQKVYKRVTIRINHNGVSLRDVARGVKIGTKKQFILKAGQFILSKIDARYGAFGIAPNEVDGAIITGNFWAYNFDKSKINIDWLNYYTNSPEFYEICERASSGITHRKYLDEDVFLSHEINLPDIAEQKEIVEQLIEQRKTFSLLSNKIVLQEELVSQLRQAFLREAMQGKLTKQLKSDGNASDLLDQIKEEKAILVAKKKIKKEKPLPPIKDDEIPFEIPENWVWCRLGEICNYGSSPKSEAKNLNKNTWVLDLEDIEKDSSRLLCKIRFSERNSLSTKNVFKKGQVLYSKLRPYLDKVIVADEDGVCTTEILPLRFYKEIDSFFIRYALKRSDFISYVSKVTKGMKMPRLGTNEGRLALIPLPPLAEQQRIVMKLKELMKLCDELEETIMQSKAQTQMLLESSLREALMEKEPAIA